MGGPGSGRRSRRDARATTDQYSRVAIAGWTKRGLLRPGETSVPLRGAGGVREVITLAWTSCPFGGQRPWFVCPGCARRCGVLYASAAGFRCRRCLALAYPSQRETPGERAARRLQAIRERLGGSPNLLAPFPPKPPRMHWRTYERLWAQAQAAKTAWSAELHAFCVKMEANLAKLKRRMTQETTE